MDTRRRVTVLILLTSVMRAPGLNLVFVIFKEFWGRLISWLGVSGLELGTLPHHNFTKSFSFELIFHGQLQIPTLWWWSRKSGTTIRKFSMKNHYSTSISFRLIYIGLLSFICAFSSKVQLMKANGLVHNIVFT